MSNAVALNVSVNFKLADTLLDFSADQGWSNTEYKRMFADLDGDGIKNLLGFGTHGTIGYFGGGPSGPGFKAQISSTSILRLRPSQGFTAQSLRGADYLGSFAGAGSKAAVIWGQTAEGIRFPTPNAVDATSITYSDTAAIYGAFGTSQGWTTAYTIDVGFVSKNSSFGTDAYGSIFGFGQNGLELGRQAFAPGVEGSAASLVAGSSSFGNAAGWNAASDFRTVRDYDGREIDLNHDGIVDVIGMGGQGTVYAFGRLTDDGAGGTTYSLDPAIVAKNGFDDTGSFFGTAQGWTNNTTQRAITDVNNDGYVDIIGFGVEGIYVSEGKAPATDGSGAFGAVYLAMEDFGNNNGWGATDHIRLFGDVNGDGVIDVIGFGDRDTLFCSDLSTPRPTGSRGRWRACSATTQSRRAGTVRCTCGRWST